MAIIGDGSFQYSIQSIWSAGQRRLALLIVVLRNEEYCILKWFAVLEQTPGFRASTSLGSTLFPSRAGMGAMLPESRISVR
jgi:benzoylformate decarboxylase